MKENILYVFVLFFMVACGAQNNPIEEVSEPSTSSAETNTPETIVNTLVAEGSTIVLPKSVAIDFPTALKSSSNTSFNKNVNRIQEVIDSEKYNLELLKLAIEEIGEACPDSNTTCHFGNDDFRVNHNHQTVILGEIHFNKYQENNKSSYDLVLNLNDDISVKYEWKEDENSVFTNYLDGNVSVEFHYFSDANQSEALYVNDNLLDEKNSFMINLENNGTALYLLTSNHIKNNKQDFSSTLRVEDEVLIEKDENFFNFSIDTNESNSTDNNVSNDLGELGTLGSLSISIPDNSIVLLDYIMEKELEDGDYLVFEPEIKVETLNLIEQLKLAIGRFTYLNAEVFGLVVNDVTIESFTDFKIIPLNQKE